MIILMFVMRWIIFNIQSMGNAIDFGNLTTATFDL